MRRREEVEEQEQEVEEQEQEVEEQEEQEYQEQEEKESKDVFSLQERKPGDCPAAQPHSCLATQVSPPWVWPPAAAGWSP